MANGNSLNVSVQCRGFTTSLNLLINITEIDAEGLGVSKARKRPFLMVQHVAAAEKGNAVVV